MRTVIIKNTTSSGIEINDLSGQYIEPDGTLNLTDLYSFHEIARSEDLKELVNGGTIVINNGTRDFNISRALTYVDYNDAGTIQGVPILDPAETTVSGGWAVKYGQDGVFDYFFFDPMRFVDLEDVVINENNHYVINNPTVSGQLTTFLQSATRFIDLIDTPTTYSGAGGKLAAVNGTEDGMEFVDSGASAGDVEGFFGTSDDQSSTTSTSWQTKVDLDFTVTKNGYFKITSSMLQSHADTGVMYKTRLYLDSTSIQIANEEFYNFKYSDGAYRLRGGDFVKYLAAGNHNIKLQWCTGVSGKAAYIKQASVIVERMVIN
jgi:hypothetical protein